MFAKTFTFFFVTLFVAQAWATQNFHRPSVDLLNELARSQEERTIENFGLIDQLKKIWEILSTSLSSILNKAQEQLGKFLEKLTKLTENVSAIGKEIFGKVTDIVEADIQLLQDKAEKLGYDVKSCVQDEKEQIAGILENAKQEIIGCVDGEIEAAKTVYKYAKAAVNEVLKDFNTIKLRIENCGLSPSCYLSVLDDAYELIKSVPSRIEVVMQQVFDVLNNVQENVPNCLRVTLLSTIDKSNELKNKVMNCILDNISCNSTQ